ncbi:MAG: NAD-dependent epimerase/dehydratase family protein [Verrucomicrobiota bacterium]
MRCLVAGCGFVGEIVCQILHERGDEVIGVVRSADSARKLAGQNGFAVEAADLSDSKSIEALAGRVGAMDAVVHCASSGRGGDRKAKYQAVYVDGCRNLLEAFPEVRLIFVSSSSVYGQKDGSEVTEESATEPDTATSRILLEAEKIAIEAGGAVARLAGIYGPGRSFLLKRFLEGASAIDGEQEGAKGRWVNQIHREDAASGIVAMLDKSCSGVFNVADSRPMQQREIFDEFCQRFEKPLPPVKAPDFERPRGWSDKRVSNAKLRSIGWQPRYASYFDALDGDPELLPSILESLNL